jgi:hypothetical protein
VSDGPGAGSVADAFVPQCMALAISAGGGRGALFDLTAGDGAGVETPQLDLFEDAVSTPTAAIVCRLAKRTGAVAFLSEWRAARRGMIAAKFPLAFVNRNHDDILRVVAPGFFTWGVAISDPCGPSNHGDAVLAELSRRIRRFDAIITQNLSALQRIMGVTGERDGDGVIAPQIAGLIGSQERYAPMLEPLWWRERLGRRHLLRSRVEITNRAFRGPVLVVTDHVARLDPRQYESLA